MLTIHDMLTRIHNISEQAIGQTHNAQTALEKIRSTARAAIGAIQAGEAVLIEEQEELNGTEMNLTSREVNQINNPTAIL